jgi:hypothetical protein
MHQIDIGINHPVAIEILSLRDALAQQQVCQYCPFLYTKWGSQNLACDSPSRYPSSEIRLGSLFGEKKYATA